MKKILLSCALLVPALANVGCLRDLAVARNGPEDSGGYDAATGSSSPAPDANSDSYDGGKTAGDGGGADGSGTPAGDGSTTAYDSGNTADGSADDGGKTTDDGGVAPDAMAECNRVQQQAAPIIPSCPTMTETWLGGTIVDGTYVMTHEEVNSSGCGALNNTEVLATLEVHGGTMDLVSYGPDGFSLPSTTKRFSFAYGVSGTSLSVEQTCGNVGYPGPFSIPYTASGNQLVLEGLNGLVGAPTFSRL